MAPRPDPSVRRRLATAAPLLVAALVAAVGAGGPADAQQGPTGAELAAQFGGFQLSARASGIQVSYDSPGLLPIPSPLIQVSLPEALTTFSSGPSSYGLGSVAYPGNLIANLPAVLTQAGVDSSAIPGYPIRSEASYPAGPPAATQSMSTAASRAAADAIAADSGAHYLGVDMPAVLHIGSITTSSRAGLESGQTVSRARVELSGVDILFGLIHIDSIVTDIVSNSNGEVAASDGRTTVSGVSVLGTRATLGADGLVVEPTQPASGPLDDVLGQLPDLGPVGDALDGVTAPLNQLLTTVLGDATAGLNELLAAGGISVQLLDPIETLDGGSSERTANGVLVQIDYDGSTAPVLSQILAAIPADQLPSESPLGTAFNASPQALFNLLKETHIVGVALGFAHVRSNTSPPFVASPLTPLSPGGGSAGGGFSPPASGFTTPPPPLGSNPAPGGSGPTAADPISVVGGIPVHAVLAAFLLGAALAGSWGSRRFADRVLTATSSSCPQGLDRPAPGRV